MRRVLVAALVVAAVLSPVVVGGGALVLLARALTGGWLWGGIAFAFAALAFGIGLALLIRWCRLQPEEVAGLPAAWGRATAFGSGGREGRSDDRRERRRSGPVFGNDP